MRSRRPPRCAWPPARPRCLPPRCRYGAHYDNYPTAYFSVACAVGICDADVNLFLRRLDKALGEWKSVPASRPRPPPELPKDGKPAFSEQEGAGVGWAA